MDTKATMNEKKNEKSILIMVYNTSTFKRKRKNGVKSRGVKLCYMQINEVVLNRNLAILNQND